MNALLIAKKELRTYFASPIAYVIMAAFLFFTGLLFIDSLSGPFREASLREFFSGQASGGITTGTVTGAFVLLLLGPVITMRLLAEESKLGTLELLLTSPVRDFEVVAGKFIAALGIVAMLLLLTIYYPIMLYVFGDPEFGLSSPGTSDSSCSAPSSSPWASSPRRSAATRSSAPSSAS